MTQDNKVDRPQKLKVGFIFKKKKKSSAEHNVHFFVSSAVSIVVTKVKLTNFRLLLRNRDDYDRKLLGLFLTSMILITASGSCFLFF